MERELMMTGIGGQGVQLAAQLIAVAALREGREVQLFGSYGGMMRGGETGATVIVGDEAISAPPTVGRTWSAIVMHHEHWAPIEPLVDRGGVVLVNTTVVRGLTGSAELTVVEVPATEIAGRVAGNTVAASMVMCGAYAAVTGLVSVQSLVDSLDEATPAYRRQHRERNEHALLAGYAAVPACTSPAWAEAAA